MKKNYKQTIKIITLGLLLSAGLGFAFSQPTSSYPTNTDAPIDISTVSQSKGGTPSASLLDVSGLLSSNGLMVFGNAYIFGNNTSGSGTLKVGGLANNSGVTYPALVCADSSGQLTVIGCTTAPTITCGSANGGTFQSQPANNTLCSDGTTFPTVTPTANGWSWSCGTASCSATQGAAPVTKTRTYALNSSGQQVVSGDSCTGCTNTTFVVTSPPMKNVVAKVWGAGGGGGNAIGSWNKGEGALNFTGLMWYDHKQLPAGGGGGGGGYSTGSISTGSYTVTVGQGGSPYSPLWQHHDNGSNDPYYYDYTAYTGLPGGSSSVGSVSAGGGAGGLGARLKYSLNFVNSNPVYSNQGYYSGAGGLGGTGNTVGGAGGAGATVGTATHIADIVFYEDQYCNQASNGGAGGVGANNGSSGGTGSGGYTGDENAPNNQSASIYLAGPPLNCSPVCSSTEVCTAGNPNYCAPAPAPRYPQCGLVKPATKGQDGKIIITWEE